MHFLLVYVVPYINYLYYDVNKYTSRFFYYLTFFKGIKIGNAQTRK